MKKNDKNLVCRKTITSTVLHTLKDRNPAIAFSMSLFFWGGGQFYNRQNKLGTLLLLCMINYYILLGMAIILRWPVQILLDINHAETLLVFLGIYFSGLCIHVLNAWQAYYKASKLRSYPFKGTRFVLCPAICSLLIPGWGQFFNGQFKKGALFQIVALAGFTSFPAILIIFHFWPLLETSGARIILEKIFNICIIISPVILVMWLFSIYDSVKVCLNDIKKENILRRLSRVDTRVEMDGWIEYIFPQGKRLVMLSLFLVLSLIISYNYLPRKYYVHQLDKLKTTLSKREMVITPDLINRFLQSLNTDKQLS